jgi:hypothetical protein
MRSHFQLLPSLTFAVALAACGGSSGKLGTVTVQLDVPARWDGTLEVLVHHADGAQASRQPITATTPVAITDGDSVTVAIQRAGKRELRSYTALHGGETVRVDPAMFRALTDAVDVHLPTVAGTTIYSVSFPGDLAASQSEIVHVTPRAGRTTLPVVGSMLTNKGHVTKMYGDRAAAINAGAIDLHQEVPWKTVNVLTDHSPGGVVSAGGAVVIGHDVLPLDRDGSTPGVAIPTQLGDLMMVAANAMPGDELFQATMNGASLPDTVTLDLAVPSLPAISDVKVDVAHGQVSWTAAGGADYDATEISFEPNVPAEGPHWVLIAPSGETALTLPSLPADLQPPAAVAYTVASYEDSAIASYDAFLAAPPPSAAGTVQYRMLLILGSGASVAPADRAKLAVRGVLAALR